MRKPRSSRSPTTGWSPISIRRCRSSRPSSIKSSTDRNWRVSLDRRRRINEMVEVKERSKTQSRGLKADSMAHSIRKIGVVGAGQMGNGIAHVCALSGFHVLLNDVAAERITEGLATISGNLARQVSRQRISDEQRQA